MLNQFAVEIPTLPVDQCHSTSSNTWRNVGTLFRIAELQRRAAKHLGHTWFFGKRFFADPHASSSAPYPQELNQWNSSTEEPLHSSTVEKSERPAQNQDLRCQSGPSAKDSVIPSEGDSFKKYGADQQRLQISDLHFDKFPSPATFACWKIGLKTEVCTCSQIPTEVMHWIQEVEMVHSVDDCKIIAISLWKWWYSGIRHVVSTILKQVLKAFPLMFQTVSFFIHLMFLLAVACTSIACSSFRVAVALDWWIFWSLRVLLRESIFPNFELLDARIASVLNKIIQNF